MTTELRRRPPTLRNQRGIALILVVMALLCLTGLLVAYLSVSALEPQISRNLADASRARYLAEAGIERGFNVLVSTADASDNWSGLLSGATTGLPWVAHFSDPWTDSPYLQGPRWQRRQWQRMEIDGVDKSAGRAAAERARARVAGAVLRSSVPVPEVRVGHRRYLRLRRLDGVRLRGRGAG